MAEIESFMGALTRACMPLLFTEASIIFTSLFHTLLNNQPKNTNQSEEELKLVHCIDHIFPLNTLEDLSKLFSLFNNLFIIK